MPRSAKAKALRLKLAQTLRGLQRMYGAVAAPTPRRGAGLDRLVEAMLAQNTSMVNAARGYRMLRRRFSTWAKVLAAPEADVRREIAICGLARHRARRLQELLRRLKSERGALSLDHLARAPTDEAFAHLMTYEGVGPKTAAYTLLFAFAHPLLPVDNGVLRVARRLRLVRPAARDLEAERLLSPLIAPGMHYATHVLLFRHAKTRCRPRNPCCDDCALLKLCPHGQRVLRHRPPEKSLGRAEFAPRVRRLARFISAGVIKRDEKR